MNLLLNLKINLLINFFNFILFFLFNLFFNLLLGQLPEMHEDMSRIKGLVQLVQFIADVSVHVAQDVSHESHF